MNRSYNQNRKPNNRGGRKRQYAQRNLPSNTPTGQGPMNVQRQPTLYPRICVSRIAEGLFDVTSTGIVATLSSFNFSLNDVPGYAELTSMFQTYCIEQIEIWWRPEYTVLSDASALSNSVNVEFNSAVDGVDSSPPTSVDALLEYQNAAHTSITQTHYRKFKPNYLIDGILPTCSLLSTSSPSTNWYGIKVAVPATGIAMTFRSVVKFKIALVGLK